MHNQLTQLQSPTRLEEQLQKLLSQILQSTSYSSISSVHLSQLS